MKSNRFIPNLAAVFAIILPLSAQPPGDAYAWVDPAIPKPDAEGWITLFDGIKLHGCSPDGIRAKAEKVGVSNGYLWVENAGVGFDISARNVAFRVVGKKVSGQNFALHCRNARGRNYVGWFNGGADFGIGIARPKYGDLTTAKASQNFSDFFQMELIAQDGMITLKADDMTVAATQDETLDQAGSVSIYALKGRSLFRKIQVKILDGPPPPLSWTNTEGVDIQGDFVRLDGQILVIRKEGKEFKVSMLKLSLASREQAKKLAASKPPEAGGPAEAVTPGVAAEVPVEQTDPDHQRKLAESVIAKRGRVEIWRGSNSVAISTSAEIPKGQISLKTVDARGDGFTDEDAALLNRCKELTRLSIHRSNTNSLPLGSLPALQFFELYQCGIQSISLTGLRGNRNLKEVYISHQSVPIGNEIIGILASCPNLETVNLHKAGITGPLQILSNLKLLKTLGLGGNGYGDKELISLVDFPALESKNLAESNLIAETLDFLPNLKNLWSLDLGSCNLPENGALAVAGMRKLTTLQLFGAKVTDEMIKQLGGHKTLRELLVSETRLTGHGFEGMKPMPALEVFQFNGASNLADAAAKVIPVVFPNLMDLSVGGKNLSPGSLQALCGLKHLNKLRICDTASLDEDTLRSIAGIKGLTSLDLYCSSSLSDALVPLLEPLKSRLSELQLENVRLGDPSIPTLGKFKALGTLNIKGSDLSKDGTESLRKALPACNIQF